MSAAKKNSNGVEYPSTSGPRSPGGGGGGKYRQLCAELDWDYILDGSIAATTFRVFQGEDRCGNCDALILSNQHRQFIFYCSPADIAAAHHAVMPIPLAAGEDDVPFEELFLPVEGASSGQEWRPAPHGEGIKIPGDDGPSRVAYILNGNPMVQVHEGDDAGMWPACFAYTVTRDGLPYSIWVCRRDVDEPCDEDFMKSIST